MIQGEIIVVGRIMQIATKSGSYRKRDKEALVKDGWELIENGSMLDGVSYDVFEKEVKQ